MARRGWILVPVLAALVAGCADPYEQDRRPRQTTAASPRDGGRAATSARRAPRERDTRPGCRARRAAARRGPPCDAFCSQWANWSWRTIARQQRRLASLATGPLARQLAAEARLRAQDRALRRDRLGARGRVVAIDVKPGGADAASGRASRGKSRSHDGRADLEGGAPPRLPRDRRRAPTTAGR